MASNSQKRPGGSAGKPHKIDSEIQSANLRRLQRIEGQIRGIQKMVQDERHCAEVLTQISAVCKALHAVGHEALRNHLRGRAKECADAGPKKIDAIFDELIELLNRNDC